MQSVGPNPNSTGVSFAGWLGWLLLLPMQPSFSVIFRPVNLRNFPAPRFCDGGMVVQGWWWVGGSPINRSDVEQQTQGVNSPQYGREGAIGRV